MFRTLISASVFACLAVSVGCGSTISNKHYSKEEARAVHGVDPDGNDICDAENWYGDGECDDFCPEPDPDCTLNPVCPNPEDPAVHYVTQDHSVCERADIACGENQSFFDIPECGCGCIDIGQPCGGLDDTLDLICPPSQFCRYPESNMCGLTDQNGFCAPLPQGCPENYAPVCGCDGVTYSNECDANAHYQSVAHDGPCETPEFCGGEGGVLCAANEFCDFEPQAICGWADAGGLCAPRPNSCPDVWDPVCGCDGEIYGNSCEAQAAGVDIDSTNACGAEQEICGGLADIQCGSGEFCNFRLEDMCGGGDQTGRCQAIPQSCPDNVDPVCGCDVMDYTNECEANAAGVAVMAAGSCLTTFP